VRVVVIEGCCYEYHHDPITRHKLASVATRQPTHMHSTHSAAQQRSAAQGGINDEAQKTSTIDEKKAKAKANVVTHNVSYLMLLWTIVDILKCNTSGGYSLIGYFNSFSC
jgi:hypothetical protein